MCSGSCQASTTILQEQAWNKPGLELIAAFGQYVAKSVPGLPHPEPAQRMISSPENAILCAAPYPLATL